MSTVKTPTDLAWEELCAAADRAPSPAPVISENPFLKLGPKPYRFEGVEAATGGRHCALCGRSIRNLYIVVDGDGAIHTLGSECILGLSNGFERHLVAQVRVAKKQRDREKREAAKMRREARDRAAAEEITNSTYPEQAKWLREYSGNFGFYLSLKGQLVQKGGLSDRQWQCVSEAIAKQALFEARKSEPRTYSIPVGATLIVGKFFARIIGRETGLNRPHFAIEVKEIHAESAKAYRVTCVLSAHRTSHCCVCGKALTNPASVVAGIGPICGARYGVSTTEELDAKLRTEFKAEITLWIPKSQIKEVKK